MVYLTKNALFLITFSCVFSLGLSSPFDDLKEVYIVYMGSISNNDPASEHIGILRQVVKDKSVEERLVRSYSRSFNGFAASLTVMESENLKGVKEVVSVFPSEVLWRKTTHSWDFLGLPEASPKQQIAESDVIIGVIDTGIWPESPSFNDDGLGPVPKKWKGGCHGGQNFTCNRKIIGARAYTGTARDEEGHGSHMASIAAGRKVERTSFYDIANGTARGGVPSARIAVYKACSPKGCKGSDIMAAFDDAIADGVDLITVSIVDGPKNFSTDSIAIGAFHAMSKGILTVQAAGNEGGRGSRSVGSIAPWLLTVAASSTDRCITTKIVLDNGKTLLGNSINTFKLEKDKYPLVYGETAGDSDCSKEDKEECTAGCVNATLVKGKILVCGVYTPVYETLFADPVGVLGISSDDNIPYIYPIPAAFLDTTADFQALLSYVNSTKDPMANIMKSEAVKDTSAPIVAKFSSRGPNYISPDILKPDISAPGVDILAAYTPTASVSTSDKDKRSVAYTVISGTSASCSHVAGVAAYVKSVHPDWSSAAIKSTLMTTATPMSPQKNNARWIVYKDAEFAYGSGHINPSKVTDPGLIYETSEPDYSTFLCNSGYDSRQISAITGNKSINCTTNTGISPNDVNYPSLSARVDEDKPFTVKFSRTVTNVGGISATYRAKVTSDSEIIVTVKPDILTFKALNERQSFDVIVVGKRLPGKSALSASVVWSDGSHSVRSPVVVYTSIWA